MCMAGCLFLLQTTANCHICKRQRKVSDLGNFVFISHVCPPEVPLFMWKSYFEFLSSLTKAHEMFPVIDFQKLEIITSLKLPYFMLNMQVKT